MKYFYLVPSKDYYKMRSDSGCDDNNKVRSVLNSENLPPNLTNDLYISKLDSKNTLALEEKKKDENEKKIKEYLEKKIKQEMETEEKKIKEVEESEEKNIKEMKTPIHQKILNDTIQVIPVYVNTLPKMHREEGRELVSDLISKGIVTVNSDGDLTHVDSNSTIGLESFLRSIFVKRATLRETANFFRMIINHIPDEVIENQKLLELKSSVNENIHGAGIFPEKVWCYLH